MSDHRAVGEKRETSGTERKPRNRMLTKAEMLELRPLDRERYIEKLLLELLSDGRTWTIRDIVEKTALTRPTITKHLQKLVSNREIVAEERALGAMRVTEYRGNGMIHAKSETAGSGNKFVGNVNYVFFVLDTEDQPSICIQQREKDKFGIESVKGAISVDFNNFDAFLKGIHTFGAKVINK